MPTSSTPSPSAARAADPNPQEPVAELLAEADLVVVGKVDSVDVAIDADQPRPRQAQTATVTVDQVLKGEAATTITVTKPAGTWYFLADARQKSYDAKWAGVFTLRKSGTGYELFGNTGVQDDAGALPAFQRVLAGRPERAPAATEAQLKDWTARADIIVFATARGASDHVTLRTPRTDFSTSATLTPIEVLKGTMTAPMQVVQGPQPETVGGTWAFPVTESGEDGIYFIDTSSGTPTVLNTTRPSQINENRIPRG
ncbi:hypothetical protein [Microbacterium sp. NPDC056052]|uniref:hypothetical protein n=1 Tax=Microbacterium sp. NPDC056052 TaxID=3345695 RepID=UPI0035E2B7E5